MKQKAVILGTRGSIPVSGANYIRYGGSTTCVFLYLGGQPIVLDAGTGLMGLERYLREEDREIPMLLTHSHLDHLMGFPMCSVCFDPQKKVTVYSAERDGLSGEEQVRKLMSPPLWPVGPESMKADIRFETLENQTQIGPVKVHWIEGNHPGGVSLLRLWDGAVSVVFITDCTLTEDNSQEILDFARDCDLLIVDGQYSEQEWPKRKEFGHNTWMTAARLGRDCGAKIVRITHHDPQRTDDELDEAEVQIQQICPAARFAREGEEIEL